MVSLHKVLIARAPQIKYDLTLHYSFTDFGEIIGFLEKEKDLVIDVLDGTTLRFLKCDFIKAFLKKYDLVIFLSYIDDLEATLEMINLCKFFSRETKILVYGPSCYYVPKIFKNVDALVVNGDWELGIINYIKYLKNKTQNLYGIYLPQENISFKPGKLLNSKDWAFPALNRLPINDYWFLLNKKSYLLNEGNKQISITISRGCPFQCINCKASKVFGIKERRRPVKDVIYFMKLHNSEFNLFQMFSPTFTYNQKWVDKFCKELIKQKLNIKWKCCTRIDYLNEKIIAQMAKAGCISIGLGIESLGKSRKKMGKNFDNQSIFRVIKLLQKYGIQPKAYIMIGIPGQTKDEIILTIKTLFNMGVKIRPSAYCPYQDITSKNASEISKMDRLTYYKNNIKGLTKTELLNIIFNRDETFRRIANGI